MKRQSGLIAFAAMLVTWVMFLASCSDETVRPESSSLIPKPNRVSLSNQTQPQRALLLGPIEFARSKGKPYLDEIPIGPDISHFSGNFVLHVSNGIESGKHRVSSATVSIDGKTVFGPSAFSQVTDEMSAAVDLTESSILSVMLKSQPEAVVEVWIDGDLRPGHGLIGSEGGAITSEDGLAQLTLPADAVVRPTFFSIKPTSDGLAPELITHGFLPISSTYAIQPSGVEFLKPGLLTLTYSDASLPIGADETHLHVLVNCRVN